MENYKSLETKILELRARKKAQERAIKESAKSLVTEFSPVTLAKNTIFELADDKEVQADVTKIGLNIGIGLLVNKLVSRQSGFKGVLMTLLVSKLSSYAIEHGTPYLLAGLNSYLEKKVDKTLPEGRY
jgi:hypothetical protein